MAIDLNLLPEGDREAIPDLNEVVGGEESAASGEQDAINHGGNNEIVGEEEDPSIVVQEDDAHGSGGQCLQHFDLNVEPDMFEEFSQGMYWTISDSENRFASVKFMHHLLILDYGVHLPRFTKVIAKLFIDASGMLRDN